MPRSDQITRQRSLLWQLDRPLPPAQGMRMFAIERIRSIALTDHPDQMPLDFKVDGHGP